MWWTYILLGIYILSCIILVTAVLLQPGKADAAALFGGGASQAAFGPRGAQNVLGWTTWVAAGVMVLLALVFSIPGVLGERSVLQGAEAPAAVEQPAQSQEATSTPPASTQPAEGTSQPKAKEKSAEPK